MRPMFQKLYRHLEDISINLREDRKGATGIQVEMIHQLETMNGTLARLDQHLAAERKAVADQLGAVDQAGVLAGVRPSGGVGPSGNGRFSARTGALLLGMVSMFIPLLVFMAFNLVQINRTLSTRAVQPAVMMQPPAIAATTAATDTAGRLAVQRHLAMLDSLITEQNQTIAELKKLNRTAVATMQRIRRHFVVSEHVVQANWRPADSLAVAR